MIVVDSSVWIDFFRGSATRETTVLRSLIGRGVVLVGDLILAEVLQGFPDERQAEAGRRTLELFPVEPMVGKAEWALRSYQDKPDATRWGGQNVYDVRSTSGGTALDGTKYSDW